MHLEIYGECHFTGILWNLKFSSDIFGIMLILVHSKDGKIIINVCCHSHMVACELSSFFPQSFAICVYAVCPETYGQMELKGTIFSATISHMHFFLRFRG